eukprot:c28036_g3_i1 orf=128-1663(+)
MSANGDLLFPQMDFLALPDFNHFPEFEDLPKDIRLGNRIGSISTHELLVDLESKSNVPLLSLCDFNNFNVFSTIVEEEEDVKADPRSLLLNSHSKKGTTASITLSESMEFERLPSSISELSYSELCNGDMDVDVAEELIPAVSSFSSQQAELQSPETMIITNQTNCLTLKELDAAGPLVHATSQLRNPNQGSSVVASVLQEEPLALSMTSQGIASTSSTSTSLVKFASSVESTVVQGPGTLAFVSSSSSTADPSSSVHSSSQISSPSVLSPSDKSCGTGPSTASLSVNDLVHEVLRGEANRSDSQISLSDKQLSGRVSLNDCPGETDMHTRQGKAVGNGIGAVPSHVLEESSQFTSLQRSHSSHALGQLIGPVHTSAFYEVPRISAVCGPKVPISVPSNLSQNNQPHLVDLQELKLRPTITSIRRVYSTGDLQGCDGMQMYYGGNSPFVVDHCNADEAYAKIGHCTLEERQMKLHRYRQKRTERNFNKKIKYACRKTLADSRPRIKGRFAR